MRGFLAAGCLPALVFVMALGRTTLPDRASAFSPAPVESERDKQIAVRFAPVLAQGIGLTPRADYPTNFDFDGDWRGDNNWDHCADARFAMKAYVYYSVVETRTHFFIHYAIFHARDYKGTPELSKLVEQAKTILGQYARKYDPTGLSVSVSLSHENDMEGCLIVAAKRGEDPKAATLVAIETLAHDRFYRYPVDRALALKLESNTARMRIEDSTHVWLSVEARGHGVRLYGDTDGELTRGPVSTRTFRYTGRAENPEQTRGREVGYDLISILSTLWPRAQGAEGNVTYADFEEMGPLAVYIYDAAGKDVLVGRSLGKVGTAFIGRFEGAGIDKARPPWGWFDIADHSLRRGDWFFDPARVVKNHFQFGESFSLAYVSHPYLGITR